jgi:hypothetical protein
MASSDYLSLALAECRLCHFSGEGSRRSGGPVTLGFSLNHGYTVLWVGAFPLLWAAHRLKSNRFLENQ